jgi:hypothetical protein
VGPGATAFKGEQLRDAGTSSLRQRNHRGGAGIFHQHIDSSPPVDSFVNNGRGRAVGANVGNERRDRGMCAGGLGEGYRGSESLYHRPPRAAGPPITTMVAC